MKPMLLTIPLFCLLLSASNCKKEDVCHEEIIIKNQSDTLFFASITVMNSAGLCQLNGEIVDVGGSSKYQPFNTCIEKSIGNTSIEILIVDPANYNDPTEFYPCDSIDARNTILRRYELTLEDLQARDFTITYP